MIISRDDTHAVLNVFLNELKTRNRLIEEYRHKPLEFLAQRGSYYPPKMEQMFLDIYFERVDRGAIKAPRGGGKTNFFGDIAACMFLFKNYDALIGSGSDAQAQKVYQRVWDLLGDDKNVAEYVPNITTRIARGRSGNWIEFVPASLKRARGPHPGEGKRGGLIIIDEEAEMAEEILRALIGTGGTAVPLIILRGSTAHKVYGSFAELLDDLRNYTLFEWDAFDVCKKCERDCDTCIPEFREVYCCGKAKRNNVLGWISVDYLFAMWVEMDKEWFEVEMMGLRPSGAGLVIEPDDLKAALVDDAPYDPDAPNCAGMDWGFAGMSAAVATQLKQPKNQETGNARLQIFDRMMFHRKGIEEIVMAMKDWRDRYGINEICADSSHPFENDALKKAGFIVHEVTFVSFKDAGAGAVKGFFEKREIDIPKRFKDIIEQLKTWRRGKDGKIVKQDDHYPDSILCTMWKWWKKAKRIVGYMKVTR